MRRAEPVDSGHLPREVQLPRARSRTTPIVQASASLSAHPRRKTRRGILRRIHPAFVLGSFLLGLLVGYQVRGQPMGAQPLPDPADPANANQAGTKGAVELSALLSQVNPPEGYALPARYGDLGPRLVASGAIDYDALVALYKQAGDPLDAAQLEILTRGSDAPIVITAENAHFLLNFFWAVGLANKNTILTEGPMTQYSEGNIERFASTGGWTLSSRPVGTLYASVDLIPLAAEQQLRVEEAAALIYRPCCDNSTLFPDCNHGMAMLGLLQLMASRGASVDEMLMAAKYVNAYWFPQQALETAVYLVASQGIEFTQADPRTVTGSTLASGSGFAAVHKSLEISGLLPEESGGSGSCAN